jgi:hypothetical protein
MGFMRPEAGPIIGHSGSPDAAVRV